MNAELQDKFERYVRREMSDEELGAFRAELEADAELRKEFNLMRLTKAAVQHDPAQYEAFKKKFAEARPVSRPEALTFWKKPWPGWLVAATLAGLLVWQNVLQRQEPAPRPVVELDDEDDMLLGSRNHSGPWVLPVLQVSGTADSLRVSLQTGPEKKADLKGNELTLYFPEAAIPAGKNIRVFMLTLDGKQELYVKIGAQCFPLKQGEQLLEEERDERVLRMLE